MSTKHTPGPFQLRSHEKLAPPSEQDGSGIQNFDVKYTILKDGEPMGFSGHMDAIRALNEHAAMLEALRAEQSIEDDMRRDGSMSTAEHEKRAVAAAKMRRAILARIEGAKS